MKTTNEPLTEILAELQASNSTKLGFGHPPTARYIYANRQYPDALWYFWDHEAKAHEPIAHHAITATIEKIELDKKEFRGKEEPKLSVHLKADRKYVLQAGVSTQFAKGLVYILANLPKATLQKSITIAVEAGESENVLFCRVYLSSGESAYFPYEDGKVDWAATLAKAQSKINNDPSAPVETVQKPPETISEMQIRRMFAIAREAGFSNSALKILIGDYQYVSTKDITVKDYELICQACECQATAKIYNDRAQPIEVGVW